MLQGGRVPRCRRFVCGYALDHSEFPCCLLEEEEASETCTDSEHSSEEQDGSPLGCCWECLRKTQMIPLVRCDKQPKASLLHWRAIWQISLLRPCEPPGHRKEVPWQMRKTPSRANFWVQPIYQELLHATSGHNVSVDERKRPCSGLVENCGQAPACQDSSSGCGHSVCCWLDWRSLSSWLLDDLVSCTVGPTSHSGAREQRPWLSPAVPAMVWWAVPRQVREATPRCTWQSHSTFPQPPISQELCQAAQCFYSGWLVLPFLWRSFWTGCRSYGKDWSKGSFWPKHPDHGWQ